VKHNLETHIAAGTLDTSAVLLTHFKDGVLHSDGWFCGVCAVPLPGPRQEGERHDEL
jgi:hypothetical protein